MISPSACQQWQPDRAASPAQQRGSYTTPGDTTGRFERSERGVYHLTGLGEAARKRWTGDGAATE